MGRHFMSLSLALTPAGHLRVEVGPEGQAPLAENVAATLRHSFGHSSAEGLLALASEELDLELPAEFVFWRGFAREFFNQLCHLGEGAISQWATLPEPGAEALARLAAEAPPMRGLEYVTVDR